MGTKIFNIKKCRRLILICFDLICFAAVNFVITGVAAWVDNTLLFDPSVLAINSTVLACAMFAMRFLFSVYFNIWRYTNTTVYLKMVVADGAGCLLALVICRLIPGWYNGVWYITSIATFFALLALTSRFVYRELYLHVKKKSGQNPNKISVAIVGAGQLGALLADELLCNRRSNYRPMFFIDTDKGKVGSRVSGLMVYGQDEKILELIRLQEISEIFVAVGSLDSERATQLYDFFSRTGCKIKIYDTPVREMGTEAKRRATLREFQIEDLLFRKAMEFDDRLSKEYYVGKTVLITGGGGSIGSELCRQIAKCQPKKLIILDIYENNAYEIQQELIRRYGDRLDLAVEIASVRDRRRLDFIFNTYRPDVVFHAAAHKHVPLMEHSCGEAVKNNVMGTYNTADMAEKYGAQKFVLISTDKAVNPTNIMGASKRMCEMIVQCRRDSNTSFAAVRFGNVLGSNGSVIPLFKEQIAQGGPVTITDKRIIRYFMTIPEASQLVIRAGAMAKKGELFVLDMGKPVRIYDLAVNMIRLSGLEPEVDIKIEEIGLRPGEKLYEELLTQTDALERTEDHMIFVEHEDPMTREEVEKKIRLLCDAVEKAEGLQGGDLVRSAMMQVVPTFHDPRQINEKAAISKEMQMVQL